jgi:hypothetical protein
MRCFGGLISDDEKQENVMLRHPDTKGNQTASSISRRESRSLLASLLSGSSALGVTWVEVTYDSDPDRSFPAEIFDFDLPINK